VTEFAWYSGGVLHWQPEKTLDWLCIRIDPDGEEGTPLRSLVLLEESHHYFLELHLFEPNGRPITEQPLDGPGPFEIPVDHLGKCVILAKVVFLGYQKAPIGPEGLAEIRCGEMVRLDGSYAPLCVLISADPKLRQGRPAPRYAGDAFAVGIGAPVKVPVVQLQLGGRGPFPFSMRQKAPVDTRVYLLQEQELPARVAPGAEVGLATFGPAFPYVTIRAHQFTPAQSADPAPWTVALPVAEIDATTGLVGEPLARTKLIGELQLELLGQGVWASWRWPTQQKWLKVHLSWDVYKEGVWADQRDETTVTRDQYQRRESIKLFDRTRALRDWYLEVVAQPVLFAMKLPDQEISHVIRL
jgi:hypothetical protein